LRGSFEEPQLWGATLGSSFREPLWRIDWGTGLKHSRFGATALQRCFGEQLWEVGEQMWGAILRLCSNIDGQLL